MSFFRTNNAKQYYQCVCASVVLRESNNINTFLLLVNVYIRSKAITYFVYKLVQSEISLKKLTVCTERASLYGFCGQKEASFSSEDASQTKG